MTKKPEVPSPGPPPPRLTVYPPGTYKPEPKPPKVKKWKTKEEMRLRRVKYFMKTRGYSREEAEAFVDFNPPGSVNRYHQGEFPKPSIVARLRKRMGGP